MHASRLDMLAVRHAPARSVVRCYDAETRGGSVIAFDLECGHVSHMAPHFDARGVTHRNCTPCGETAVKADPAYAAEFEAACDAAIAAIEAGLMIEAPRNTATYCDGKAREFTTVLLDGDTVRYAAIAGQTCSDPLDCVALTESEAHEAGRVWALKRITRVGTDPARFYRVERLPAGWSNDGRPAPAMVPQQVQQQQARDARHAQGILSPGCISEASARSSGLNVGRKHSTKADGTPRSGWFDARCINANSAPYLTVGQVYRLREVRNGWFETEGGDRMAQFRFSRITSEERRP